MGCFYPKNRNKTDLAKRLDTGICLGLTFRKCLVFLVGQIVSDGTLCYLFEKFCKIKFGLKLTKVQFLKNTSMTVCVTLLICINVFVSERVIDIKFLQS